MTALEKQIKVQRRISLQTSKRDAQQVVPPDIIHSIVQHQILLFKHKAAKFDQVYRNESGILKKNKIISDWIYVASNYCVFLADIDPTLCAEMAIELFTAFYLILKLAFKKLTTYEYSNLSMADQGNINIFYQNFTELLKNPKAPYLNSVVNETDKLVMNNKLESKNISNLNTFKRLSLDPKLSRSLQSPSELYPQFGDEEEEEEEDDDTDSDEAPRLHLTESEDESHLTEGNHRLPDSESDDSYNGNSSLPSIDGPTLKSLNTSTVVLLNINIQNIKSRNRKIITINPAYVDDVIFYQQHILPFLSFDMKIVIFSESSHITHHELTVSKFLYKAHFRNVYWLEGGLKTFIHYCTSSNKNQNMNLTTTPKIPSLNELDSPNLHHTDNKSMFNSPEIPPIPKAKPLLPTNGFSNNHPANNSIIPSFSTGDTEYQKQLSRTENQLTKNYNRSQMPLPAASLPLTPSPAINHAHYGLSSSTLPYSEMKLHFKPLVTLKNMGSTCYIDSLIQCLFSVKEFRNFFIDDDMMKMYLMNLRNTSHGKQLPLTSAFHELFNIFYQKSPSGSLPPLIDMTRFLSVIAKLNPSLSIPNEQQDTSQFLYFILDVLHTELKLNSDTASQLGFIKLDHSNFETKQYNDWKIDTLKNEGFSYIQNLFNIKESVVMKCERCGYKSVRYDTSVMVHLSIDESSTSLMEIIERNFYSEEMSERLGNAWACDGCKKAEHDLEKLQQKLETVFESKHEREKLKDKEPVKEKKKRNFFKFSNKHTHPNPNLFTNEDLTSNVSDFEAVDYQLTEYEKSEYNRLAEIFTRDKVAYRSVELIELPNVLVFCLSVFNSNGRDAKTILKNLQFPEILDMNFLKCKRKYKLNSWIDHWGSNSHSGHYTATINFEGDKWITCDDDKLGNPSKKSGAVKDSNVYLLFYEAVDA